MEMKELFSSHIPALQVLVSMGYEYISPENALELRGSSNEVLLTNVLETELSKRMFYVKGVKHALSKNGIDQIIREIKQPGLANGLMTASQKVYDMLTLGFTVNEFVDGKKVSPTIPLIDWKNFDSNSFIVTDEFSVTRDDPIGDKTRRPDIVCFINGIPLAVIECKRPDSGGDDPVREGISQMLRNQKQGEIPKLFSYAQLLFSVNGIDGKYGTTKTIENFWSSWTTEDEEIDHQDYQTIRNRPLDKAQLKSLFSGRDQSVRDYFEEQTSHGELIASPQDRLLISLLRRDRLLEFIRFFVLYDKDKGKIIARHQQFFAIRRLVETVMKKDKTGARDGGVIWHTTGSGKSFTMVFMAKSLILNEDLKACRFVLVTDRTDLEDQLKDVFITSGAINGKRDIKNAKAKTGKDLANRISHGTERILFSIINKFMTAAKSANCYNDSADIIVLVDEGHRSQSGESHQRMRKVLPNASFVAFTGTPLLKDDKTTNKFGKIIHAYTMQQAVEDKAVTPLLYEERIPELGINSNAIDNWFERITEGLTEQQKADLKRKFSTKNKVLNSSSRTELIAHDISDHFIKNIPTGMKGQIAADGRANAIEYKKYLDEIGLVSSEVVISSPDSRKENLTENHKAIQEWWDKNVGNTDENDYRKEIVRRFGTEKHPQILIVSDKLLTGFDEPKNMVLYIDKPLKNHNLIQAIARVNRLHEDKKFGLLIDYRGILKELDIAIDAFKDLYESTQGGFDISDLEGLYHQTSTEYKKLPQCHKALWGNFESVENKLDREQFRQVLIPKYVIDENGDEVDKNLKVREDFYQSLREFSQCLAIALGSATYYDDTSFSEGDRRTYKRDLNWFESIRKIARQDAGESVEFSHYEDRIKVLIDKHVVGESVKEPKGVYLVSELGRKDNEEEWSDEKSRNEAELIKSQIKKTIEQQLIDPYAEKVFSELLKEAILEAEAMFDHPYKQYLIFKQFQEEMKSEAAPGTPEIFKKRPHARAFYGVFRLVLGEQKGRAELDYEDLATWVEGVVNQAVAEHSLNVESIEAAISKNLLTTLFKSIGIDAAKEIIQHVIEITKKGLAGR